MPFVNQRWLGGMLTNFSTVFKRLQRLKELEEIDFGDVAGSGMTKKELLQLRRERDKLDRTLGGIRDMARVPSAIWVVDTKKEHIAVSEARKLGIPVVAILDTNCDPDEVNYPIPGNDDAIRSVALLTRVVADAVADGLIARAGCGLRRREADRRPVWRAEEPLAEWERELLQGSAPAAAPATRPPRLMRLRRSLWLTRRGGRGCGRGHPGDQRRVRDHHRRGRGCRRGRRPDGHCGDRRGRPGRRGDRRGREPTAEAAEPRPPRPPGRRADRRGRRAPPSRPPRPPRPPSRP